MARTASFVGEVVGYRYSSLASLEGEVIVQRAGEAFLDVQSISLLDVKRAEIESGAFVLTAQGVRRVCRGASPEPRPSKAVIEKLVPRVVRILVLHSVM